MSDVHCANCGEPWDSYHMIHDEVWECNLPEDIIEAFNHRIVYPYKEAFEANGWRFAGENPLAILRCPACGPYINPDKDQAARTKVASDLLGDDLDGYQSMMED